VCVVGSLRDPSATQPMGEPGRGAGAERRPAPLGGGATAAQASRGGHRARPDGAAGGCRGATPRDCARGGWPPRRFTAGLAVRSAGGGTARSAASGTLTRQGGDPRLRGSVHEWPGPRRGTRRGRRPASFHRRRVQTRKVVGAMAAHVVPRWTQRVFSNLRRWALGTFHGLGRRHLRRRLDEFVWRWNARRHAAWAFDGMFGRGARVGPASARESAAGAWAWRRSPPPRARSRPRAS
jgi:hypothetical protein